MSQPFTRLLILGCGYVGDALARKAMELGVSVTASTRSPARADALSARGITPLLLSVNEPLPVLSAVEQTALVATFPPDGMSDARLAPLARGVFASAYVSSTGVYGDLRGTIDDDSEPAPDSPRSAQRLAAEQFWRAEGSTILRVAAIYGPFRGMHERVREGSARIAGAGTHHICRIHVDDLVASILRTLELGLGPRSYVLADDEPAQQGEVVRYLARLLDMPEPASVPLESVSETLRHDRRIDAGRFKQHAGIRFQYPDYRSGFAACLAAEAQTSPPGRNP